MKSLIAVFLFALGLSSLTSTPAKADWIVCNETSFVVRTAIAYRTEGRRIIEGWRRIRPGGCEVVKNGPLTPGLHHLFGLSSRAHQEGVRQWGGAIPMCIDDADFSIAGDQPCDELDFNARGFMEVPITKDTWRTTLVEPDGYGQRRARAAGIQRLLLDNGYGVRTVDGYMGARTVREMRRALGDFGKPRSTSEDDLIDLLEQRAADRRADSGLTVCNRARVEIWTAVAYRRGDGWQSRGWWALAPEECAKLFDARLRQQAYYVYAERRGEFDDRPQVLSSAEETFCLAETKFAILGRDECIERGYIEGRFATVLARSRSGVNMEITDRDFATAVQ